MAVTLDQWKNDYVTGTRLEPIPLLWSAPESILECKYSKKSDIYMLGYTLLQILSIGSYPFSELLDIEWDPVRIVAEIVLYGLRPECPPSFPMHMFKDILYGCFAVSASRRPTTTVFLTKVLHYVNQTMKDQQDDFTRTLLPVRMRDKPTPGIPRALQTVQSAEDLRDQVASQLCTFDNSSIITPDQFAKMDSYQMNASYPKISHSGGKEDKRRTIVKNHESHNAAMFFNELRNLQHENLARIDRILYNSSNVPLLQMELPSSEDLLNFCLKMLPEHSYLPVLRQMFGQVASAMAYLHSKRLLHRSLCADKVYMCWNDMGELLGVKVGGLDRIQQIPVSQNDPDGSVTFIPSNDDVPIELARRSAREVNQYKHHSMRSDVASFGILIWEALMAFSRKDQMSASFIVPYGNVPNGQLLGFQASRRSLPRPSYCTDFLAKLIKLCMINPQHRRPLFPDIVQFLKDCDKDETAFDHSKDLFYEDDLYDYWSDGSCQSAALDPTDDGYLEPVNQTDHTYWSIADPSTFSGTSNSTHSDSAYETVRPKSDSSTQLHEKSTDKPNIPERKTDPELAYKSQMDNLSFIDINKSVNQEKKMPPTCPPRNSTSKHDSTSRGTEVYKRTINNTQTDSAYETVGPKSVSSSQLHELRKYKPDERNTDLESANKSDVDGQSFMYTEMNNKQEKKMPPIRPPRNSSSKHNGQSEITEGYERKLKRRLRVLQKKINYSLLQSLLSSRDLFSEAKRERVLLKKSSEEKVKELVAVICEEDKSFYWKFLWELEKFGAREIVNMLETPGLLKVHVNVDQELADKVIADETGHRPFQKEMSCMNIKIYEVYHGSVVYILKVTDVETLERLKALQVSGVLNKLITEEIQQHSETRNVFAVSISDEQYAVCKRELQLIGGIAYRGYQESLAQSMISGEVISSMDSEMVVEHLWQDGILEDLERENLMSTNTRQQRNITLLKLLQEKDKWAFVCFILALDQTGQEHIANLFQERPRGDLSIMTSKHRDVLRQNHTELIHRITLDEVLLETLVQRDVLSSFDYQRITYQKAPYQQNITLLHILKTKPDRCFSIFCKGLCTTQQCHLSVLLRGCHCGAYVNFPLAGIEATGCVISNIASDL